MNATNVTQQEEIKKPEEEKKEVVVKMEWRPIEDIKKKAVQQKKETALNATPE